MKKRIGTLKGHPIVDGDINLVRYPKIHQKTLGIGEYENPFSITLPEFIEPGPEGNTYYCRSVIFPVNVLIPDGVLVVVPEIVYNSVSGLPELQNQLLLKDYVKIIPANLGVLIFSYDKKKLSFVQTTENVNFPYPFNGIGVYQDSYTQEVSFLQKMGFSFATLGIDISNDTVFTPLEEGSLIPKYTPLWIYKKLPLENKIKLNHIFKKK